ncbi:hypothetical protein CUMW_205590, partial [Citrus unshiu]
MPSLSPEIDRKATDRSFEVPRNRHLDSPRGRRFAVDRPLKDSRLWELDPEPSPRADDIDVHLLLEDTRSKIRPVEVGAGRY